MGLVFTNFPVFFPVIRELEVETGSRWTASSATLPFADVRLSSPLFTSYWNGGEKARELDRRRPHLVS